MRPPEYADLHGDELIDRVMLDRDLSRASAADTVMLWDRPEGDVIELPPEEESDVRDPRRAKLEPSPDDD